MVPAGRLRPAAHKRSAGMARMVDELEISESLSIPLEEIELTAVRSQGAGGQNVNKVASAIHLRFDIAHSPSLPSAIRQRLLDFGDKRISSAGVLVIKAQEHRTQARNREAALSRLREFVQTALLEKKRRIPTRPSGESRRQRLEDKRRRGALKRNRGKVDED